GKDTVFFRIEFGRKICEHNLANDPNSFITKMPHKAPKLLPRSAGPRVQHVAFLVIERPRRPVATFGHGLRSPTNSARPGMAVEVIASIPETVHEHRQGSTRAKVAVKHGIRSFPDVHTQLARRSWLATVFNRHLIKLRQKKCRNNKLSATL